MNVESAKIEAIKAIGQRVQENALMEIRVGFAKDILIPRMARFVKETQQHLHPLNCNIHKSLSYDLVDVCGPEFANVVNLGGITVFPVKKCGYTTISVFTAYDPRESVLKYIVAFSPLLKLKTDLFEAIGLADGKKTPVLSNNSDITADVYVERKFAPLGREADIHCTALPWTCMNGDSFFNYLESMWEFVADFTFALAGPTQKNGVI